MIKRNCFHWFISTGLGDRAQHIHCKNICPIGSYMCPLTVAIMWILILWKVMYRLLFVVPNETVSALAASDKFASCCRCLRMAILGSSFFLRLRGQRHEGKVSGSLMSFLRSTTRCMAVRNSSRERPPSLLTSLSCQIVRSSLMGSLKNEERF